MPGGRNGGQTSPSDSRTQPVWQHLSSVKNPQKHWEETAGGWAPGVAVVLLGAAVQRQDERARAATNPHPFCLLCVRPAPRLPPGDPPQTRGGANGGGAAPVAAPDAATLLFVCLCLEAPPRKVLLPCVLQAFSESAGTSGPCRAGSPLPTRPQASLGRAAFHGTRDRRRDEQTWTRMKPGSSQLPRAPRREEACDGSWHSCPT